MQPSALIGPAVTLLIFIIGFAVAWGRWTRGQEEAREQLKKFEGIIDSKLQEIKTTVRSDLDEFATVVKVFQREYVRTDVDEERRRRLEERDTSTQRILSEIRDELKDLRRNR